MVYNIGSHDLPLGEIGTKVNDNTYHIVRFQRFGGNATLQLDDYNVQTVHPQGWDNFDCLKQNKTKIEHKAHNFSSIFFLINMNAEHTRYCKI